MSLTDYMVITVHSLYRQSNPPWEQSQINEITEIKLVFSDIRVGINLFQNETWKTTLNEGFQPLDTPHEEKAKLISMSKTPTPVALISYA